MAMLTADARWFVIPSGEHAGRPHLNGWALSAIKGEPQGSGDDGWLEYAVCPRCHAMVLSDDRHAYGDQTWAHEQWHAATDWPIPSDVLAEATR